MLGCDLRVVTSSSPLNGERAGVRGEKAKSFEFPRVRFMESSHLHVMCTRIGAMNFR